MAIMYPEKPRFGSSHGEVTMFEKLHDLLESDFAVFHGVRWIKQTHYGPRDAEADFVICHPRYGVMILEVKGGQIRYDGNTGTWSSNGNPLKESPFKQATDNMYDLKRTLQTNKSLAHRDLLMAYAVAFPETEFKQSLGLDAPREILCDSRNLVNLNEWIKSVYTYWHREDRFETVEGGRIIDELKRIFASSWEIKSTLGSEFRAEKNEIVRLSEEQYYLLDFLSRRRRVAISGCAGSGKTMLAIEQARRLGRQGYRVLLTCFNRNLAEYIASDETISANIEVLHFHGVVSKYLKQAALGRFIQTMHPDTSSELLMDAIQKMGPQYDAIIVDEGQDFDASWWIPLQYLLHDPDEGILYLFYDDNQNLYQRQAWLPQGFDTYLLTQNRRNTKKIHQTILSFYKSPEPPIALGPEGRPPQVFYYEDDAQLKKLLSRLVHEFTQKEYVDAQDIVILTPRSLDKSVLPKLDYLGNFHLTNQWPAESGEIFYTTVHQFKGLESPVVILIEISPTTHQDLLNLLYTGCSRARNHLIILGSGDLPKEIQANLPVPSH